MGADTTDEVTTTSGEANLEDKGMLDKLSNALVGRLMDLGIDGFGPIDSASEVVAKVREEHHGDEDKMIREIVSDHVKLAGAGGFVTGVGGIVTLPVALPANVVEFYALATRMVAAIAEIRGYDVTSEGARAAIMLSLVGADAEDLMKKVGVSTMTGMSGSGRLAQMATSRLPRTAGMMINKAVGFRLLTNVGGKMLSRLVRFVPIAGGIVGAGLDGFLMKRIADGAREEFVPRSQV